MVLIQIWKHILRTFIAEISATAVETHRGHGDHSSVSNSKIQKELRYHLKMRPQTGGFYKVSEFKRCHLFRTLISLRVSSIQTNHNWSVPVSLFKRKKKKKCYKHRRLSINLFHHEPSSRYKEKIKSILLYSFCKTFFKIAFPKV